MSDQYRNRYRIKSARAAWRNYGLEGSYFITICTRNRVHFFGEIKDEEMVKSVAGLIVERHWQEIPQRFSFIDTGAFILMPNHIHGILNIKKTSMAAVKTQSANEHSTGSGLRGGITGIHNPMLHQNLSRVIRWFTGRVSYEVHKVDPDFNWQRRFYDHIIRNKGQYSVITTYILTNPKHWKDDQFY